MSWMIALTAVLNISAADPFQLALRTRTLEGTAKERAEELARMLGGRDLTSVTLKHAEEMLAKSASRKPGR